MSRETLDDDRTAPRGEGDLQVLPSQEIHVETAPSDDAAAPVPPPPPTAGRTRRQVVQACAATALVVAVVVGLAMTAVGGGPAAPDRDAVPRLLGSYIDASYSMTVLDGSVPFDGRVQVVNAGALPVEVLRVDGWGSTGDDLVRPVLVAAGAAELVGVTADLPCGTPVEDRISLRVAVVDPDGIRGDPVDVELERIDTNPFGDVQDILLSACVASTDLQARADGMALTGDGVISLDVATVGDGPRQIGLTLLPDAGLDFTPDALTSLDLPEGGGGHLAAGLVVTNCAVARASLEQGYDVIGLETVDPSVGEPVTSYHWVEGWSPPVASAAIGFAVARQCG